VTAPKLLTALLCLALLPSACGQDDEGEVRDTLDAFAEATAGKDYQRLCNDLFARQLVEEVRRTVPCEVALRNSSLDEAQDPRLEVGSVRVEGDEASAQVRTSAANQRPSQDTIRLVREDDEWRILSLAS
jgi:hypothetical protein